MPATLRSLIVEEVLVSYPNSASVAVWWSALAVGQKAVIFWRVSAPTTLVCPIRLRDGHFAGSGALTRAVQGPLLATAFVRSGVAPVRFSTADGQAFVVVMRCGLMRAAAVEARRLIEAV